MADRRTGRQLFSEVSSLLANLSGLRKSLASVISGLIRCDKMNGLTHSVLIIEDDHATRVALRSALEDDGYFVYSAPNGFDALSILNRIEPPFLILLDQNMPLMSGDEFLTVKQRNPEWKTIPVVTISGFPDQTTQMGAIEFMEKPLNLGQLLATVRKYCPRPPSPDSPLLKQHAAK